MSVTPPDLSLWKRVVYLIFRVLATGILLALEAEEPKSNPTDEAGASLHARAPSLPASANYRVRQAAVLQIRAASLVLARDDGAALADAAAGVHPCKLCYAQPANMLFNECGHLYCCELCVVRMAGNRVDPDKDLRLRCPVCRAYSTVRRIYPC